MEIISFIPSECMDFPILNDFMTIEDLKNISMVNKYFNHVSKKQMNKQMNELFNFIEKLEKMHILINNSSLYSYEPTYNLEENAINNSTSTNLQNIQREILPYVNESKKTQYNPLYWYNLFGKKLNPQELALYYAYFILNYHTPSGRVESTNMPYLMITIWNCVSYEDGFIKSLPGIDNSFSMSRNKNEVEHYILFKKLTKIEKMDDNNKLKTFEYNYDIEFDSMSSFPNNMFSIDIELLKNIYTYIKKNGICDQNMRKYIYPSIKDAIMKIYHIS